MTSAEVVFIESVYGGEEAMLAPHSCHFNSSEHFHEPEAVDAIWWCNAVFVPVIAFCGLSANLLNIAILLGNRAARRIPSWQLLLALAVADCFFLVFGTLEVAPEALPEIAYHPVLNKVYTHLALYCRMLASTAFKSSILIVVAFNIERYVSVVYPLRAYRVGAAASARVLLLSCVSVSLLCSVQFPLCYRVIECVDSETGASLNAIQLSPNRALQTYFSFMNWFSLVAFNILPIGAVLALNARIISTLSKVAHDDAKRRDVSAFAQERACSAARVNANAMLFAVVVCLLICVGPQAPARLLFEIYGDSHATAVVYSCLTQLLVFLNASLNFCLYCLVSKRYRTLMRGTIKMLAQGWREERGWQALRHGSNLRSKTSSAHATLLEEQNTHKTPPTVPEADLLGITSL